MRGNDDPLLGSSLSVTFLRFWFPRKVFSSSEIRRDQVFHLVKLAPTLTRQKPPTSLACLLFFFLLFWFGGCFFFAPDASGGGPVPARVVPVPSPSDAGRRPCDLLPQRNATPAQVRPGSAPFRGTVEVESCFSGKRTEAWRFTFSLAVRCCNCLTTRNNSAAIQNVSPAYPVFH